MPSLLRHHACPGCGVFHDFVLESGSITAGEEYAFMCPRVGRLNLFLPDRSGVSVGTPPQGAVSLTGVTEVLSAAE
jgi:hypothetical protein